jgi:hypothetical protein
MQYDSDWYSCAEAGNLVMPRLTLPIVIEANADGCGFKGSAPPLREVHSLEDRDLGFFAALI